MNTLVFLLSVSPLLCLIQTSQPYSLLWSCPVLRATSMHTISHPNYFWILCILAKPACMPACLPTSSVVTQHCVHAAPAPQELGNEHLKTEISFITVCPVHYTVRTLQGYSRTKFHKSLRSVQDEIRTSCGHIAWLDTYLHLSFSHGDWHGSLGGLSFGYQGRNKPMHCTVLPRSTHVDAPQFCERPPRPRRALQRLLASKSVSVVS